MNIESRKNTKNIMIIVLLSPDPSSCLKISNRMLFKPGLSPNLPSMIYLRKHIGLAGLLIFTILHPGIAQDTLFYGANGAPVDLAEEALCMKRVSQSTGKRYVIRTWERRGEDWEQVAKQRISVRDKNHLLIRDPVPDRFFPRKVYREIEELGPESYRFRDATLDRVLREGTSSRYLPLHLEGTVTEYHSNGKEKSVSEYRDNQLVSNRNWLPDGSRYIDSIFYSAEEEPEFIPGPDFFRNYIIQNLRNSMLDLSQVQDEVRIGWVVMEDGEMNGIIALKGKSRQLNQFLVDCIASMPGRWEPAVLNGQAVRYFMSIPLNFIHQEASFQEVDFSSGRLNYSRY